MIVPMKHVTLLCVAAEREATLERLRALGVVHLEWQLAENGLLPQARAELLKAQQASAILRAIQADKQLTAEVASSSTLPCSTPDIVPLLTTPIREVDCTQPINCLDTILELQELRQRIVNEIALLRRDHDHYRPFGNFDITLLARLAQQGLASTLFRAPLNTTFDSQAGGTTQTLNYDANYLYGIMIGSGTLPPECQVVETPILSLATIEARITKLEELYRQATAQLRRKAPQSEQVLSQEIARLQEHVDFAGALDSLRSERQIAWIHGWVPTEDANTLRATARQAAWGLLLRDPLPTETPPTLLRPPRIFKPVLALFKGLGIAPAYNEADISIAFFCFFSIFFAMLVGDGGYGILLLIATWWAARKWRQAPRAPFVLMTVFSLATLVWGTLSNTWFGAHPAFASSIVSHWLDDMNNMMLVCFSLGVVHLSVARLGNAMALAPDTKALAELGWIGVIWFMYCMACSIVGIFQTPGFMYPLLGISLLLIFLFTLKRHELRSQGIELGMLPLNIVSALGDIISYVRLFAVSLASVRVAENFNSMAISNNLPLWAKIIPMVLILLVGHGLNMAMAALSILVHAVRLNTLEFSNHKGISWAGYAFNPFKKRDVI